MSVVPQKRQGADENVWTSAGQGLVRRTCRHMGLYVGGLHRVPNASTSSSLLVYWTAGGTSLRVMQSLGA